METEQVTRRPKSMAKRKRKTVLNSKQPDSDDEFVAELEPSDDEWDLPKSKVKRGKKTKKEPTQTLKSRLAGRTKILFKLATNPDNEVKAKRQGIGPKKNKERAELGERRAKISLSEFNKFEEDHETARRKSVIGTEMLQCSYEGDQSEAGTSKEPNRRNSSGVKSGTKRNVRKNTQASSTQNNVQNVNAKNLNFENNINHRNSHHDQPNEITSMEKQLQTRLAIENRENGLVSKTSNSEVSNLLKTTDTDVCQANEKKEDTVSASAITETVTNEKSLNLNSTELVTTSVPAPTSSLMATEVIDLCDDDDTPIKQESDIIEILDDADENPDGKAPIVINYSMQTSRHNRNAMFPAQSAVSVSSATFYQAQQGSTAGDPIPPGMNNIPMAYQHFTTGSTVMNNATPLYQQTSTSCVGMNSMPYQYPTPPASDPLINNSVMEYQSTANANNMFSMNSTGLYQQAVSSAPGRINNSPRMYQNQSGGLMSNINTAPVATTMYHQPLSSTFSSLGNGTPTIYQNQPFHNPNINKSSMTYQTQNSLPSVPSPATSVAPTMFSNQQIVPSSQNTQTLMFPNQSVPASCNIAASTPSLMYQNQQSPGTILGINSSSVTNLGLQSMPGTNLGMQSLPGTNLGMQSSPGTNLGIQPSPGTNLGIQPSPGTNLGMHQSPVTNIGVNSSPMLFQTQQPQISNTINSDVDGYNQLNSSPSQMMQSNLLGSPNFVGSPVNNASSPQAYPNYSGNSGGPVGPVINQHPAAQTFPLTNDSNSPYASQMQPGNNMMSPLAVPIDPQLAPYQAPTPYFTSPTTRLPSYPQRSPRVVTPRARNVTPRRGSPYTPRRGSPITTRQWTPRNGTPRRPSPRVTSNAKPSAQRSLFNNEIEGRISANMARGALQYVVTFANGKTIPLTNGQVKKLREENNGALPPTLKIPVPGDVADTVEPSIVIDDD